MRNFLKPDQVAVMIEAWDEKTIDELANDFGVNRNTIIMMAKEVNKINPDKCKPKKRNRRTRRSVAEEALSMLQ